MHASPNMLTLHCLIASLLEDFSMVMFSYKTRFAQYSTRLGVRLRNSVGSKYRHISILKLGGDGYYFFSTVAYERQVKVSLMLTTNSQISSSPLP